MKKLISILLVIIMLASTLPIQAQETIQVENQVRVTYNGFEVPFDVLPRIIGSSTMVPLRAIFELLGAEVEWIGHTREVVSTKGNDTIKFAIGSSELYKNGVMVYNMPMPATIIEENGESRTLVPLRAISESLGYIVDWNAETKTAVILSPEVYENIPQELRFIGEFPVSGDVYDYFLSYSKSSFKEVEQDFFEIPENKTALDNLVAENLYEFYAIMTLANTNGMSMYRPLIKQAIDNAYANYEQYYGENFELILKADDMTPNVFKMLLFATLIEETFSESVVQAFDSLSEYEKTEILINGDLPVYRATHILFSDKSVAESVLPEAKAASDDEFFTLIKTYTKDTASEDSKDGYYFTSGHMIEEFESTVAALKEGETSDIVETVYGHHIIRRLPVEKSYIIANMDVLARSYAQSKYYAVIGNISKLLHADE